MSMTEELNKRIESLESSLLFLQREHEELQQTVVDQYQVMQALKSKLQHLEQRYLHQEESPPLPPALEDRPPHY